MAHQVSKRARKPVSTPPPPPPAASLAITYRTLDDLIPYARNARTHPRSQLDSLKASMRTFGWGAPILIADNGVLAGHARLLVAKELRDEQVIIRGAPDPNTAPTVDLSHMTGPERRAYILADNKIQLAGGWDDDLLAGEFAGLLEEGFDVGITGFDELEIDAKLNPPHAGHTDPDEVPEVPKVAVTQPGDVWLLGATVTCPHCRTRQEPQPA